MDLSNLLPAIENASGLRAVRPSGGAQLGLRAVRPSGGARLDASEEPTVLGVSEAAKAAVVASLARRADGPVLVVVPKAPQALALVEELAAWLGGAVPIRLFPERDTLPYERLLPDPEALRDRLRALEALQRGRRCVVVASGIALAQRTLPRQALDEASVELRAGGRLTPETLLVSLLRQGYRTTSLVELPGDAARRGGIVDVFPATGEAPPDTEPGTDRNGRSGELSGPVRVEFMGERIESLRRFDPES